MLTNGVGGVDQTDHVVVRVVEPGNPVVTALNGVVD